MKRGFLLDVIVAKSAPVLELFPGEDETLLIGRNAFLILNLRLHVLDRIRSLDFESDRFSRQRLDEDLHTAAESKNEMKSRFLLNVIVAKSAPVLELFPGEDETLLIGGNAFLVLDFRFHILDRIRRFHFERDRFSGQRFDENLHAAAQTENEMESRFLLDVVVAERATVFELLSREDESLLIGRDSFFVLDFRFYVFDRVRGFDLERDRFAREGFDEDLHR